MFRMIKLTLTFLQLSIFRNPLEIYLCADNWQLQNTPKKHYNLAEFPNHPHICVPRSCVCIIEQKNIALTKSAYDDDECNAIVMPKGKNGSQTTI